MLDILVQEVLRIGEVRVRCTDCPANDYAVTALDMKDYQEVVNRLIGNLTDCTHLSKVKA